MGKMKNNKKGGADKREMVDAELAGRDGERAQLPQLVENHENRELLTGSHSNDGQGSVPQASEAADDVNEAGQATLPQPEDEKGNAVEGEEEIPSAKGDFEEAALKQVTVAEEFPVKEEGFKQSIIMERNAYEGDESGTEEEQAAFMKELDNFFKERSLEFKPLKFYGEGLNYLKLWRAVTKLGGYDQVTTCKLWRQVGESFKPPKTCTTVSWTFRGFYEKALLEYERHKMHGDELPEPVSSRAENMNAENQASGNQASGSGRTLRDAAARAMQGWHTHRLLGNDEVTDPIIKDKNHDSVPKREKQLKTVGVQKRKKASDLEPTVKAARTKVAKPQTDIMVVDLWAPADWVKVNVQKTKDCFEVYALVPGLLREEVRVQSDPVGRLVITGEPEKPNSPWGITPFKKVISLAPSIDPQNTPAIVTLHGQLFVRVPFEQSEK